MVEFFRRLFGTDFMPHVYCLRDPALVFIHAGSDVLIALSYFLIPAALLLLVKRRRDLAFSWMFLLFGIFILACGTTHALAVYTLWHPVYRFEGVVKILTALASIPTALLLFQLVPKAVALPSPAELAKEVSERREAEAEVRRLNAELEQRVKERTAALEQTNRQLREANEKLAESESKLQAILDASPAAVYVKDLDGRFTLVNRESEEILGLSRGELYEKTMHDLFSPEMADVLRRNDQDVIRKGQPIVHEERVPRKDGMHTYLSVKFPLFDRTGRAYALCNISTDITERKQVEEARERHNRELEELAFAAAHDLQEPLRHVIIQTQLLERRHRDRLDEDGRELARQVVSSASRMRDLLKSILAYSEANQGELSLQPVPANASADAAIEGLGAAIQETKAHVTRAELPTVRADSAQLTRVFQNLIGNALKYRSERPPRIQITGVAIGNEAVIRVSDNGIGIGPEYLERVFGLFKRLHGAEYPGTGVGLTLCKRIIERSGGRIWIESQLGEGTTVCFSLPLATTEQVDGA